MRQERARGEQEAAMLREAAANDLATARAHHAAEMAAVAAERQVALPTPLTPRTPLPPSSSSNSSTSSTPPRLHPPLQDPGLVLLVWLIISSHRAFSCLNFCTKLIIPSTLEFVIFTQRVICNREIDI